LNIISLVRIVGKDYVFRRDAHRGAIPFLLPAQEIKNGLCPFRRSRSIPDSCSAPLFSCLSKRKGAEKRTTQGRGRLRFLPERLAAKPVCAPRRKGSEAQSGAAAEIAALLTLPLAAQSRNSLDPS